MKPPHKPKLRDILHDIWSGLFKMSLKHMEWLRITDWSGLQATWDFGPDPAWNICEKTSETWIRATVSGIVPIFNFNFLISSVLYIYIFFFFFWWHWGLNTFNCYCSNMIVKVQSDNLDTCKYPNLPRCLKISKGFVDGGPKKNMIC
jgi:hypothetical protein